MSAAAPATPAPAAAARADGHAGYYPWFDWLRAVLAIGVMLGHDGLVPWDQAGNFAVQVFFALSGWLIGGMLVQLDRPAMPRFYFNRAVRIWVPYYIALALLLAASLLRDRVTPQWLEFVAYKATFVYNWFGVRQMALHSAQMPLGGTGNHFWSVNAEEQFYLLAPLLLVFAARRGGRTVALWLAIAVAAWVFKTYASIVFGVTAAVIAARAPGWFERPLARAALAAIALACTAALVGGIDYELVAPPLALAIVMLLAVQGPQHPFGAVAGGMSYPLYLNHWIGVFVAHGLLKRFGLGDSALRYVLSSAVSIGIAVALYWFVDRVLLQRRRAWFTPPRGRRLAAVAYGMVVLGLVLGLGLMAARGG